MAKTSSCSIGVTVSGGGETATYVPPGSPVSNPAAPNGGSVAYALAAGVNSIAVPTGAIGVVISPPTSSTNAKTAPAATGQVGVATRANAPSVTFFDAAVTTFDITSAGIEVVNLHWL